MADRTDREIVDAMAREFYRMLGYVVPADHHFYDVERRNYHPQEALCWAMACHAQQVLTDTDPADALANLDDGFDVVETVSDDD